MTICIYMEEMQTKLCKCIYRYIFYGYICRKIHNPLIQNKSKLNLKYKDIFLILTGTLQELQVVSLSKSSTSSTNSIAKVNI